MLRFSKSIAILLAGLILAPVDARAQSAPPSPPKAVAAPAVLTLKERLGAKWKDEQRVDNCRVPPEKRGSKPRPDRCGTASPK